MREALAISIGHRQCEQVAIEFSLKNDGLQDHDQSPPKSSMMMVAASNQVL